ncbi:serine protease SP24D [Trichinella spiralis]|uniref:serine protease SP24D n=1 Tax=Trichinella spiralis TaxID=6334 RepID=UPI0001EFEF5E|nr:serine protease SP24D [Trichinella spiralis]
MRMKNGIPLGNVLENNVALVVSHFVCRHIRGCTNQLHTHKYHINIIINGACERQSSFSTCLNSFSYYKQGRKC